MYSIFETCSLSVFYGSRAAVSELNLKLEKGHSLGILGLNGAGKTSTIRALLGMIPFTGKVNILEKKPGSPSVFGKLGFAPEEGVPPEFLTGEEYLSFVASLKVAPKSERKKAVSDLLDWFELDKEKYIREYSKGMRRRIVLAQAFLGQPELLILDEPLNGLDPIMIIKLRERLQLFRKDGGSILYSSHILSEVEKTCTDIAILHEGHLKYSEKLEVLISEFSNVERAFTKFVGATG